MSPTAEYCSNCGRILRVTCACDISFAEKLKTLQLHGSVGTRRRQNYFDDESLKHIFGGKDRHERADELMETTKGIGAVTSEQFDQLSPKDQGVFFGDDLVEA